MLEDMIARLQERVTDEAESEEDLSENERELSRLSMELMEVQGISASQKKEISRLRAEITSNREQMQDLEERKRNLLVQSNRVGEGKRVEKRLPVASPTNPNMKQFWIFVTNQRLHLVDSLVSGEPYHSDVVILERGTSHTVVTVRNERGQPIRQGFEGQGKMAGFLNATSPQRVVVQAMVDKESFKEFNLVKEVLIQNGYRYFFDIGEVPIRFVHGSGSNFENF